MAYKHSQSTGTAAKKFRKHLEAAATLQEASQLHNSLAKEHSEKAAMYTAKAQKKVLRPLSACCGCCTRAAYTCCVSYSGG